VKRDFPLAHGGKWHPISPMKQLPHTHSCFVCGESNKFGLNLRFETDGNIVRTHFTPRPEHVGFKQVVHGGIAATLLDEIMVWACAVQTKQFAYCAELTVRFLSPLRPGQEVFATGELIANRRNKILEAKGEIKDRDGKLLASSTGKYLPIKAVELADMATDFVGNPGEIMG
jgi:uncharacterized protein (TIGR00369 family)